ncbi:MAG: phosphopantetheine-binding protein [Cyclobacteriaceae bacterium]
MKEDEMKTIVFQSLKQIAPETAPEQLGLDENMRETLNIDSFDALQFIVALSEKLNIEIPEKDYGQTSTLRNLMAYLKMKIQA